MILDISTKQNNKYLCDGNIDNIKLIFGTDPESSIKKN